MDKTKGYFFIMAAILIVILALLIIFPVLLYAPLEMAREEATRENIVALRQAIKTYYDEHKKVWPTDLITNFTSYLYPIPPAKATPLGNSNKIIAVKDIPVSAGTGWAYNSTTGQIWCNSIATDSKGISFTTY